MDDQFNSPEPLTDAELLNPDDETVESLVFAHIDDRIQRCQLGSVDAFSSLTRGMRYVYSTVLLEAEIDGGGFNQYFFSVSSDFALDALAAYCAFGAHEHQRVLRSAISIYHQERWFHFRVRLRRSLEAFFDSYQYSQLADADERFHEISEDIVALRAAYVRKNLDDFTAR
jgi:hypothetical protein